MNITLEIKADKELLEVLTAIKDALTMDKQETKVQQQSKPMTLDEFVAEPEPVVTQVPTLEEVRAKLTELSRAGKRAEVNSLIKSYGASKLTDLSKEHYIDIMQKAGEL